MEELFQSSTVITSPVFDHEGSLHFCSSQTGDIVKVEKQSAVAISNTKCPNGICFDSENHLFICDLAEQAILTLNEKKELIEFVKYYEGKKLLGPNTAIFNNEGTMYFTDSGPMGETTLQNPKGSVFIILDGELLQPIALNCLAHPSGIALSQNENLLFVAETMKNRILRFVQKPLGVYHCTVFYQFSGRFGPTALCCDNKGNLYVANFDFYEDNNKEKNEDDEENEKKIIDQKGMISIISPEGKLKKEIFINGPEITGLIFDNNTKELYITEGSTKSLSRTKVTLDDEKEEKKENEKNVEEVKNVESEGEESPSEKLRSKSELEEKKEMNQDKKNESMENIQNSQNVSNNENLENEENNDQENQDEEQKK